MGRGKAKVKFDVRDLLFPEQHINEQEAAQSLIKSRVFSIIAQVYSESDKFLRVGKIVKGSAGEAVNVEMVSPLGFLGCRVSETAPIGHGGKVNFYLPFSPFSNEATANHLSTANPRYLQSKIRPQMSHPVSSSLLAKISNARDAIPDRLRSMLDQMIDKMFGESICSSPKFDATKVSETTQTYMARLFAGEISLAEVPIAIRNEFDQSFKAYSNKRDKFGEAIQKGKDFVDGEKWVYIPGVNGGVVLGAISPEPMLAALDRYTKGDSLPDLAHGDYKIVETIPFKWYKSFENIPDEYRRGLEYSLVMLKTHRGSDKILPDAEIIGKFWHEMGCYTVGGAGNDHQFLYLSR